METFCPTQHPYGGGCIAGRAMSVKQAFCHTNQCIRTSSRGALRIGTPSVYTRHFSIPLIGFFLGYTGSANGQAHECIDRPIGAISRGHSPIIPSGAGVNRVQIEIQGLIFSGCVFR
jgi:hypothetical protein